MFFLRFQSLTGRMLQAEIVEPEWESCGWVSDEEDLDNSTCCGVGETLQDTSDRAFEALSRACGMKVEATAVISVYEFLNSYAPEILEIAAVEANCPSCLTGFWCFSTCSCYCPGFLKGEAAEKLKKVVVLE